MPIAPPEARNRFNYVFYKFIKAVVTFVRPLIIFLDDLQWAEKASIDIIRTIFLDSGLEHVLFIGAYREIEAADNPPLNSLLKDLRQTNPAVRFIKLEPLDKASVGMLIRDTLAMDEPEASRFINLIAARTACNPLFVKEFLIYLYEGGLLRYRPACHSPNFSPWQVDINGVFTAELPDSISTLLTQLLGKLPPAAQRCLQIAACIGSRFTMALLVAVCEKQGHTIAELLKQAVDQGMLIAVDGGFKFIHDRIRETAYGMIDPEKRAEIHYAVGKALLSGVPTIAAEPVFEIASQLNSALPLLDGDERTRLMQLNLSAGKKAKGLTAYTEALDYFKHNMELLGAQAWQEEYDTALAVHTEAAETAYLCSDFEYSETLIRQVVAAAHTVMDRIGVLEIRMRCLFSQHRLAEAVTVGVQIQKLLGYKFPHKPGKMRLLWELLTIWPQLRKTTPEDLQGLIETRDPNVLAHSRLLTMIGIPTLLLILNLFELILIRVLRTTFSQGLTPESSSAMAFLGAALCKFGLTDTGYRLGQAALALIRRPQTGPQERGRTLYCVYFSMCWKDHIRETLQPLQDAYKLCLESGEPEIAANAAMAYCSNLVNSGTTLADVLAEINQYVDIMRQSRQQQVLSNLLLLRQSVLYHMGLSPSHFNPAEGAGRGDDSPLPSDDPALQTRKNFLDMLLNFMKGNYAEAVAYSSRAMKSISQGGYIYKPAHYYGDSLMRIGLIDSYTADPREKRAVWKKMKTWFVKGHHLRKIAANQMRLKKAARYSPINFMNKWVLIEAERKRLRGKKKQAEQDYHRAIDLAKEHRFLLEEALANEALAKHCLASSDRNRAEKHFQQALKLYEQWGSAVKKHQLLETYGGLLMPADMKIEAEVSSKTPTGLLPLIWQNWDRNSFRNLSAPSPARLMRKSICCSFRKIFCATQGPSGSYCFSISTPCPSVWTIGWGNRPSH